MIEPPKPKSGRGETPFRLAFLLAVVCLPLIVLAAEPTWWAARGVKTSAPANDYAAVNQGQLKQIASAAAQEMQAHLPGGAGDTVNSMVAAWGTPTAQTNDYAAVNAGQLKAVAQPFYDRLIAVGYTTAYPWTTSTNTANDYAMVNIGQLKNILSFDPMATGLDDLPAWWERYWSQILGVTVSANAIDSATGLTYLQEFLLGRTPGISAFTTQPADAVALEVYTPLR